MTFKIDPTDIESTSNRRHRSSASTWNGTLLFGGFSMSAIPSGSTAQEVLFRHKGRAPTGILFLLRPCPASEAACVMIRTGVPWITFLVDSASNFLGNSAEYQLRQGV